MKIIGVHHIGYAVRSLTEAKRDFELLGFSFGMVECDDELGLSATFGKLGGYCIELLSSSFEKKTSIDSYLDSVGPVAYHICYEVRDIFEVVEKLRNEGFFPASKLRYSKVLDGNHIFMYSQKSGLIELVSFEK